MTKFLLCILFLAALNFDGFNCDYGDDVHDYIQGLKREELIEVAFACERYHRKIHGETHLMGGLHDYVFRVPDEQIRNYVIKEVKEHQELNDIHVLRDLSKKILLETEELKKYGREFVIGEGIHDYLWSLNRKDLEKIALGTEEYHRKIREEYLFGGLHDYIATISDEDLRSYIIKEVNEHYEINNIKALKEFLKNESHLEFLEDDS